MNILFRLVQHYIMYPVTIHSFAHRNEPYFTRMSPLLHITFDSLLRAITVFGSSIFSFFYTHRTMILLQNIGQPNTKLYFFVVHDIPHLINYVWICYHKNDRCTQFLLKLPHYPNLPFCVLYSISTIIRSYENTRYRDIL